MVRSDLPLRRLAAHRLVGRPLASPVAAVRWMGAVQAQDYNAASWAVALRCGVQPRRQIEAAFDSGRIVRTHVLRPTWHLVAAEDVEWLLRLTGPQVRKTLEAFVRRLGIDLWQVDRAVAALARALEETGAMTRDALRERLVAEGHRGIAEAMAQVLIVAEVDRVIVSGPRRGARFTYMLWDRRIRSAAGYDRDAAVRDLARRYYSGHGPASLRDLAWWSGLPVPQLRDAVHDLGAALRREVVDGVELWSGQSGRVPVGSRSATHLLPNFDEYTVAYTDRHALHGDAAPDPRALSFGSVLSNVVLFGGRIVGGWRRVTTGKGIVVEIRPFAPLPPAARSGLAEAARLLARHVECPVDVVQR